MGLSLLTALVSFRYFLPAPPAIPAIVAANAFAQPWLPLHAVPAAVALLVGPLQFLPGLRARRPRLHRWVGRTYVGTCLTAGAAGLVLALGTSAGAPAAAGFGALAAAWIYATLRGWRLAVQGRIAEHRRWMIRSFALTFAAVTLRLQLPLAAVAPIDSLEAYRLIAWLCWAPNLLAVEAAFALSARSRTARARLLTTPAS